MTQQNSPTGQGAWHAFVRRAMAAVEYAILHPQNAGRVLGQLQAELTRVYVDGDGARAIMRELAGQPMESAPHVELTYLACPYTRLSDQPAGIEERRYAQATLAAATLVRSGKHVFSPITHGHPLRTMSGLPGDWSYWQEYCQRMVLLCDSMSVLMLPGWQRSEGVAAEIALARRAGKPVVFLSATEILGPRAIEADQT